MGYAPRCLMQPTLWRVAQRAPAKPYGDELRKRLQVAVDIDFKVLKIRH